MEDMKQEAEAMAEGLARVAVGARAINQAMPEMSPEERRETVRALRPHLVILTSARNELSTLIAACRRGK